MSISLISAVFVIALGVLVAGTDSGLPLDTWMLSALRSEFPHTRPIALAIDWCGEPIGAVLLTAALTALCLLARRRRLAMLAVASQGVAGGATELIKPVVGRVINGGFLAYPSGHTAGATALAIALGLLLVHLLRVSRAAGLLVVVGTAGVVGLAAAWAQTMLNAHYTTDTVGGFCTALALIPTTALVIDLVADRHSERSDTST